MLASGVVTGSGFGRPLAAEAPAVPAHNRADLREPPPPPPADERLQQLGARVFDAVARNEPALAESEFFPRPAFLLVKAIADPGRYWAELHARFARDITALHRTLRDAEHAAFERLELSKRGGFVRPGEEANHLPYFAARHNFVHYRDGERRERFELRVLISWDDRWYVIHLSEFRSSGGQR